MCVYCERKTTVGWNQPALCDENWKHFSNGQIPPDQVLSNLRAGEDPVWEARIHDYQSRTPQMILTSDSIADALWGNGVATIYVPILYCPVCGRKLGRRAKEQPGKEQGWIFIHGKEDLPEEKINPITLDFCEYPCIFHDSADGEFDEITDIRYYKFGRGHWFHGLEIMDDYVVAWMDISLPEAGIPQEG